MNRTARRYVYTQCCLQTHLVAGDSLVIAWTGEVKEPQQNISVFVHTLEVDRLQGWSMEHGQGAGVVHGAWAGSGVVHGAWAGGGVVHGN